MNHLLEYYRTLGLTAHVLMACVGLLPLASIVAVVGGGFRVRVPALLWWGLCLSPVVIGLCDALHATQLADAALRRLKSEVRDRILSKLDAS